MWTRPVPRALLASAGTALLALGASASSAEPALPRISHGPIAGDVTAHSAVVWARGSGSGWLRVSLVGEGLFDRHRARVALEPGRDFTAQVAFGDLAPDTRYRVRVRADDGRWPWSAHSEPVEGRFRTAPAPDAARPVRVAFGGDVAGQNVCRDVHEGFPAFEAVRALAPDLFVGLGDMIYADNVCEPIGRYGNAQVPGAFGRAATLPAFWAHWRYARDDPSLARLLASAPYVAVWDDHEVANDVGPEQDERLDPPYAAGTHLLPLGLHAFLDHNPVSSDREATPGRLYRRLRWGRHVELFVLDTRQYRDANARPEPARPAPDAVGPVRPAKTLLGREQTAWLLHGLATSDATWKIVVSSVPMAIPTGSPPERGRDGWADGGGETGFERELVRILASLRDAGVRETLWITTDVHFATVLRHTPFPERDPDFRVVEIATGPLNAMVAGADAGLDPTLHPEALFVHAPASPRDVRSWEEAKGWFNFGLLDVDAAGRLRAAVVDARGHELFALELAPGRAAR